MQLRNIRNQIKQKIEEAQLNMVMSLDEMGLGEAALEELQTQIARDGSSQETSYDVKIASFLTAKIETAADDLKDLATIKELSQEQKNKLIGLRK